MIIKFNEEDDELFCVECKERIHLNQKYLHLKDCYLGETYFKDYHMECIPETEDDE
jgi:hypothetical protein